MLSVHHFVGLCHPGSNWRAVFAIELARLRTTHPYYKTPSIRQTAFAGYDRSSQSSRPKYFHVHNLAAVRTTVICVCLQVFRQLYHRRSLRLISISATLHLLSWYQRVVWYDHERDYSHCKVLFRFLLSILTVLYVCLLHLRSSDSRIVRRTLNPPVHTSLRLTSKYKDHIIRVEKHPRMRWL